MENGTKIGFFSGIFSAAALLLSCIAMAICLGVRVEFKSSALSANTEEKPADVISVVKTEEKTAKYKAEIEDGYIVVRGADGGAVKMLKTPVRFMTDGDREYFAAGVEIFTDEELAALCDDFGN